MLTVKQKFCVACGSAIEWDELDKPAFFDPVHGQPRFYVRGTCPNKSEMLPTTGADHDFGIVSDYGPHGYFPMVFGIMDDHPAVTKYMEAQEHAKSI